MADYIKSSDCVKIMTQVHEITLWRTTDFIIVSSQTSALVLFTDYLGHESGLYYQTYIKDTTNAIESTYNGRRGMFW